MPPETSPDPNNVSSEQVNATKPEPAVAASAPAPSSETNQPLPTKKGLPKKKLIALVVVAVVLLLGASVAAAYFAVILPAKPENRLASAFVNLADQEQVTVEGKVDVTNKKESSDMNNFAVDYKLQMDLLNSRLAVSGDVGVGGTTFPFESRFVDKNLYTRVGGLGRLGSIFSDGSTEMQQYFENLNQIDNQWFVVDRSFLQQSGVASCVSDISFALSDEDVNKVGRAYKKHPLFMIKSTSQVSEAGGTTRFELDPASDEVARQFVKELRSLSVAEKVRECADQTGVSDSLDEQLDNEENLTEKIYAFVDRANRLKKLELLSENDNEKTVMTMNFDFAAVDITKPEGARPIQELIGLLYGGSESNAEDYSQMGLESILQ